MSDTRLYAQLDRIEDKLDIVEVRLDAMDVLLTAYNADLKHHIARTTQVEEQLMPIAKQIEQVKGAGALVALLSLLAGIASAVAVMWP